MLLGDFFTITELKTLENNSFTLRVTLNPAHKILTGHFPGNPIVPGVCLTQLVKEILESILHKKLRMTKADNIKFTAIVNPKEHPVLETKLTIKQLENERVQAELAFFYEALTFYKFKGSFAPLV